MPEVLADEDPRAPAISGAVAERRLEGAEPVPCGDIALLVEDAVGRQVHLAVDVPDLTVR